MTREIHNQRDRPWVFSTGGGQEPYVRSEQLPATLAAGGGLRIEGVAGGVALPISGTVTANQGADAWAPVLTADVTDDDSDKTFIVPVDRQWLVESIYVTLASTAAAGNRQLAVQILTAADVVVAEARAGAVQAASLTRRYQFALGAENMLAFMDTSFLTVGLPPLILPAGYKVRVWDNKAIAAAADDMHVQMMVQARTV